METELNNRKNDLEQKKADFTTAMICNIIIIIIIIFIPFIYGIHPYVPRQTMSVGDTLLQLLFRFIVSTVCGAYLPPSYVGSDGLLRQHFPQNVCSA